MNKKNRSNVLFNEIERQEEARVRDAAGKVAHAVTAANNRLDNAERELKCAKKHAKKIQKALNKFKKTGDMDCLSSFGV